MYTLLKAISALQLARRTEREHGTPAIALFWVEAEDHDWAEIRSCTVLDAEFQPRTVTLADLEGAGETADCAPHPRPRRRANDRRAGRPAAAVRVHRHGARRPARGVEIWYRHGAGLRHLARARARAVRPGRVRVGRPRRQAAGRQRLRQGARRTRGKPPPSRRAQARNSRPAATHLRSSARPTTSPLFSIEDGRKPIKRSGDQLAIGDRTFDAAALAQTATASPASFSPNVLLRPIVQDTLFPTVCYVAGPSELAYLGQLRGVYDAFGVPMPLLFPRTSATLLDSGATRFLRKYDVPFEELRTPDESALNKLLEAQLPANVEASLRDAGAEIDDAMTRVMQALPQLDPTLAGAAKTTLGKMEHELRSLHTKVIHAAKKRHDVLRRQFVRAQAQAFPEGHPQERMLGCVYFLNKYGPGLVASAPGRAADRRRPALAGHAVAPGTAAPR